MNGNDIFLDTNILLYFLRGDKNVQKFFLDYNPIISFVTELEILSSPELSEKDKLNIQQLLSEITIVNYADNHKQAILKIQSVKRLKLPDAIIAATAITLGIPLVTADSSLKNIPSLNVAFYNLPVNE